MIYQKLIFPGKNAKRRRYNKIYFLAFAAELYGLAEFRGGVGKAHPLVPPYRPSVNNPKMPVFCVLKRVGGCILVGVFWWVYFGDF